MKIIENNQVVDIKKVRPNNYNPKKKIEEDEDNRIQYEKVKKSIREHGQIDPVLVREVENGFEIVNGFHRYMAMKELGYDKIEIKNLGKISRQDAIAKALSTEEIHIPLDQIEVAELVKEYKESEFDLNLLPYNTEEIQEKIELLDFDWDSFNNQDDFVDLEEDKKGTRKVICPKCGNEFEIKDN